MFSIYNPKGVSIAAWQVFSEVERIDRANSNINNICVITGYWLDMEYSAWTSKLVDSKLFFNEHYVCSK